MSCGQTVCLALDLVTRTHPPIRGSGGNLKLAQELARHKDNSTTQLYAHLSNDEFDWGHSDEERKGALAVCQWPEANFMEAGHKRLGRLLIRLVKSLKCIERGCEHLNG